jgi:hypothetical protein
MARIRLPPGSRVVLALLAVYVVTMLVLVIYRFVAVISHR